MTHYLTGCVMRQIHPHGLETRRNLHGTKTNKMDFFLPQSRFSIYQKRLHQQRSLSYQGILLQHGNKTWTVQVDKQSDWLPSWIPDMISSIYPFIYTAGYTVFSCFYSTACVCLCVFVDTCIHMNAQCYDTVLAKLSLCFIVKKMVLSFSDYF